jgi:hypothetical protein
LKYQPFFFLNAIRRVQVKEPPDFAVRRVQQVFGFMALDELYQLIVVLPSHLDLLVRQF